VAMNFQSYTMDKYKTRKSTLSSSSLVSYGRCCGSLQGRGLSTAAGALQRGNGGDTASAVMRDHAKDGKRCGGAALTHRGRLQLGFGWRSQL
jgi:hypothetical protein